MDLDAIKQQIESYRDKYRGDPDIQIMLTVLGQMISEVERLKAKNNRLAAHQCQYPAGDEFGNAYCTRIKELKCILRRVQEWGADARSADSYTLFRDVKEVLSTFNSSSRPSQEAKSHEGHG